jgi:hypothetical protein
VKVIVRVRKRSWLGVIFLLVLLIGLAACQSDETDSSLTEPTEENDVNDDSNEDASDQEPNQTYPLTGIKTNEDVNNRVIGVMVNNHPKARPQSGLHKADVVYEVLAEGWVTRLLALYQGDMPEVVGPVRSARNYYITLNSGYNALYVHHGWSPGAKQLIETSSIDNLNGLYYDGTLFERADFRSAPHNSYITHANILKGVEEKGYDVKADVAPLPFYNKEEISSVKGNKAGEVTVDYDGRYSVRYDYDPKSKTYLRYSDGEQTVDLETDTPISVSNVLIVEAEHRFIDDYGRRAINLEDGGRALLLQQGLLREMTWKNEDGRILPEDAKFLPGKTWINIVPEEPGLDTAVETDAINEE